MTQFSELSMGDLKETKIRTIRRSDIQKCPNTIMVASHYRDDSSCKCNDVSETVMKEWGYRWSNGQWR